MDSWYGCPNVPSTNAELGVLFHKKKRGANHVLLMTKLTLSIEQNT